MEGISSIDVFFFSFFSDQFNMVNFLFMFHFAASEVKMSEEAFAERSAGADCLRDLIRRAKKHLSPKVPSIYYVSTFKGGGHCTVMKWVLRGLPT